MAEMILGVFMFLGTVFILCKLIGKASQVFGLDEINSLMGKSLSMRAGDFSSKQKDLKPVIRS